jgi:ATP-dependent DNA helicase HFM1/MER3
MCLFRLMISHSVFRECFKGVSGKTSAVPAIQDCVSGGSLTSANVVDFRFFNAVQSECFHEAFLSDVNMVVSSPTGSGKTVIMELAILRVLSHFVDVRGKLTLPQGQTKTIYVGPSRALVQVSVTHLILKLCRDSVNKLLGVSQERVYDWAKRFGSLGLVCRELTGDTDAADLTHITSADIICTTPEKFGKNC